MIRSVAIIGLGEVGQTLAADLAAAQIPLITAFDILFTDADSVPSRAQSPAVKCSSIAEAVQGRDLVISAVTAASDAEVAASAAPHLKAGAFFLDVNSASPKQKSQAAAMVDAAGGRYVEAAVMTPIHPRRIASPMLLGGPHAGAFLNAADGLGFSATNFSPEYGKASAVKMCRSVVIKGMEALLAESMLAARHYGVEEPVLASLSDLLPAADWTAKASYMIGRSLQHGKRRAEEMREVAETVRHAGIAPAMSRATADRQDWAAQYRSALDGNLPRMLDAMLEAVRSEADKKSGYP